MADSNDVFSATPTSEADVVLDLGLNDLVGEGRKYSDPDQLAKAYGNLEAHARKLEAENAQARAERDRLEAAGNTPNQPNLGREQPGEGDNPQSTPQSNAPNSGNQVDLRSQIREEVKALNETERAVQNMEAAAAKMIETFGSPQDANSALQQKARELGVSVDWLRDSAGRSPQAFFATMGLTGGNNTAGTSRSTPSSGGGVNMSGGGEPVRNFEYFDKIRKDDSKLYFSAATQGEMMRNARTMGADFYKR